MRTIPIVEAHPALAGVVGRLLCDFNTEFDTTGPSADDLGRRFAGLLGRSDVLVLLSHYEHEPSGFAYLTLRPTPYSALRLVDERGVREMHINVDEVDLDARRFYERHHFVNLEPGTTHRMLFYLRELSPPTSSPRHVDRQSSSPAPLRAARSRPGGQGGRRPGRG